MFNNKWWIHEVNGAHTAGLPTAFRGATGFAEGCFTSGCFAYGFTPIRGIFDVTVGCRRFDFAGLCEGGGRAVDGGASVEEAGPSSSSGIARGRAGVTR